MMFKLFRKEGLDKEIIDFFYKVTNDTSVQGLYYERMFHFLILAEVVVGCDCLF